MNHPLLRFLNKEQGPIVKLTTARREIEASGPYFYSAAELSSSICGEFRKNDALAFGGGGWSLDRQLSQEKAIVEAIERWAFRYFSEGDPLRAGIEIDPTSNGFAAVPAAFGSVKAIEHSFYEALERYALNRFWQSRDIKLEPIEFSRAPLEVQAVSKRFEANYQIFHAIIDCSNIETLKIPGPIHFVLVLAWRPSGGVTPGSACGHDLNSTVERAALEAVTHLNVLDRIERGIIAASATVTDRRLLYFGNNKEAGDAVKKAIEECLNASGVIKCPQVLLMDVLPGPWEPEVIVSRVVLDESPSFIEGDEKRFLI